MYYTLYIYTYITFIYTHIYICMCAFKYVYAYIYIYINVFIDTCIYIELSGNIVLSLDSSLGGMGHDTGVLLEQ
jgi:hypothetical protein